MRKLALCTVLLFFFKDMPVYAQDVWTIGPMIHFNFGGDKMRGSFAIETAYWNLQHFPYSVDGGIEFEHKKLRLYSELQTGIGLAGVSAGPVLEFNHEGGKVHLGLQTTTWINYFLGVDFRMRWLNDTHYNAIGVYGKLPIASHGLSSDGSHHAHHYGNFDWD